jgi:hypothetical protein
MASSTEPNAPAASRWRAAMARMLTTKEELHASQEHESAVRMGGTPITELVCRTPATVCGTLRSVTLRPRGGVPALEADVYDGSGTLTVVWLGRRQIAGIEPGRQVRIHGMITQGEGGGLAVFNPRYELVARERC